MELFEKREDFRQMGTTGLGKSKARVSEVAERYAQKDVGEEERRRKGEQLLSVSGR